MGVTSFKLFMTYKKRPKRMVSDEFIAKTMERLAALGGLCQLHCENGDVLCYLEDKAIAQGRTAPTDFPATARIGRRRAINRAILIGRLTDCPVYVVHLSTKLVASASSARRRRAEGVDGDLPAVLALTDKEMQRLGPSPRSARRSAARRRPGPRGALGGSEAGFISTVASDHSPRVPARKTRAQEHLRRSRGQADSLRRASLETLVPLMYTEGVSIAGCR